MSVVVDVEREVKTGTGWRAGPHVFLCGDVLELAASGMLDRYVPAVTTVYTDPPWDPRITKAFFGKVNRRVPRTFDAFLDGFVAMLKHKCPEGGIGIEMGLAGMGRMWSLLDLYGATTWGVGDATYGSYTLPMKVWFGTFGSGRQAVLMPQGLHGKAVLQYGVTMVADRARLSFFDPFCGDLTFSNVAIKHGFQAVYGTELQPGKLAYGLKKLQQRYTVERIV